MMSAPQWNQVRQWVVGVDRHVPLLDGSSKKYVNFDNAATTPPFQQVMKTVEEFLPWYAAVHRGTGFKSQLSTHFYEQCREVVAGFVNADLDRQVVIFTLNATHAINIVCHHLPLKEDQIVLTTLMEHHSNLLPWWVCGKVDYVRVSREDGRLDLEQLEEKFRHYGRRIRLLALCGASNVSGCIPPLRQICRLAHEHGALVLCDATQLVAHRQVDMNPPAAEEHIDFVLFSAHKMYAPFGAGVLVGPREFFLNRPPYLPGGGEVELVSLEEVEWTELPEREEAGTPNVVGVVALAEAIKVLQQLGMETIAKHERQLTTFALEQLRKVPRVNIFGNSDPSLPCDRVSVIPIQVEGMDHALLAAILSYEWGIGVRHGCFCAHPYILELTKTSPQELSAYMRQVKAGDHRELPGFARISLGLYNTKEEVEYCAEALREIVSKGPRGNYEVHERTGEYFPTDFSWDFDDFFRL